MGNLGQMQKIIFKSFLSPGDALVLTAAIESLHLTYPGEYETDVRTAGMEIWQNNPRITSLQEGDMHTRKEDIHYPLVHESNQKLNTFLHAYISDLSRIIERPLTLMTNRPHIYLTEEEKSWLDQIAQHFTDGRKIPFWLVNAGTKNDFTCKQWPIEYYQKVIDDTIGQIQWVQVGSKEHAHHPLRGVIDLRGQTNNRQFIRLVYHSKGGLGPVTYLQHLCAAFEKPYMCLLGGREGVGWTIYPRQTTFHTIGQLPCCMHGGCWKSRVVPLQDNDNKNNSLCDTPVLGYLKPVPKCMAIIKPTEVITVLQRAI